MRQVFRGSRTQGTPHPSLGESFANKPNSLNAMRAAMAAAVITSHSWHLGGYGPEPQMLGLPLGSWAVLGFFGISGYLITKSRVSQKNAFAYYRSRALRILPGLWISILVVVLLLVPATAVLTGRDYSLVDAYHFIVHNGILLSPPSEASTIGDTLTGLPDERFWNAPLWTLFWEVFCYAVIGLFGTLLRPRLFAIAVGLLFSLATGGLIVAGTTAETSYWVSNGPIGPITAFFAGSLMHWTQRRLALSPGAISGFIILAVAIALAGQTLYLIFIPYVALILMVSVLLPLARIRNHSDISFGLYIYGWPVQQCVAIAGLQSYVPPEIFAITSLITTSPLAWLSYRLIERPAQRMGRPRRGLPARSLEVQNSPNQELAVDL